MSNVNKRRVTALDRVELAYGLNAIVRGRIVAEIKGGYTVDLGGLKALLPRSKAAIRPIRNLDKFVADDTKYDFEVIKFNKRRRNIVVSRRVPLQKDLAKPQANPWTALKPIEGGVYSADKEIRAHLRQFWESRGRKVEIVTPTTLTPQERAEKRAEKRASIEAFLAKRSAEREAQAEAEAEAWSEAHNQAAAKAVERQEAYLERVKRSNEERRQRLAKNEAKQKAHNEANRQARIQRQVNLPPAPTEAERLEAKAAIRRFIAARAAKKAALLAAKKAAPWAAACADVLACTYEPTPELAPEPAPKASKKRQTKQAYLDAHRVSKAAARQQLATKLNLTVITEAQALEIVENN